MAKRQVKHIRKSKKGKKFVAGKRARTCEVSNTLRRQIMKENAIIVQKQLKSEGKVRLPELGTLKIKIKKARPARMGVNPFTGEKQMFKAKPRSKVVKFTAAKALKEAVGS